jgi:methylmalonyl-CoA/ethylmalonyl-CoA epimerase
MEFDHLGVVVKDLAQARVGVAALLLIEEWTPAIEDHVNGVIAQFGRDRSGVCYELLQPLGPASPVAAALKSDRILNHVAYRVADLAADASRLRRARCVPTGAPRSAVAYGGRRLQFFLSPLKFYIELIEAPGVELPFSLLPAPPPDAPAEAPHVAEQVIGSRA